MKSVATYADLSNVYWHDGSRFSVADIVMGMILAFDPGKSESVLYNNAGQDISGNFLTHFKGVKIVSTDPLVIETYEDLYTLDAENNVYSWWPGSRADFFQTEYAWHMVGAGIRAEAEGKLAFEGGKANATGIPWANYVMGSSLAILNSEVVKSYNDSFIPYWPTLHNYISSSEAKTRWNNYKNWYGVHKHFWLGTGPFYLDTVSSTKLVMKRFAAFPDYASRWDAYRSLDPSGLTTPILPINKQVVPTNEPKISLIPVIGARHYQYQISEVPDFSSLVYDIKRNTPHYDMFLEELDLGKTYFWRARALDDDGNYNQWSEPRSFLTNIMIWPENEIYLLPATVFFNWKYVAPTSLVNLQVANDSSFDPESIVIDQTMNGQLFHSFIPGTTLPPGKYYWRMRINDFHEWREFTPFWTFTVTRFQPELVSPLDGSSSPVTTPLLDWDPVIGGDHFQVQVSSLEDFSSLIINENLSPGLDSFEIVSSLTDGLYYWRVRGITVSDITLPWSESWSFRVDNIPPTAPVLVNPIGGQVLNTGKLALSVDGTTEDTTNYQFQVSTSSDFSTTALVDETIASPNYSLTDGEALPLGHTYYWRAKAIDGAGFESPWSAGDSFSLTILNSPINGATTANLRPTFSWLGVQGASEYKIQIGTDTSFSGGALVSEITQSDTFYTPPSDFSEGSYYWQVAVHLPSGWSDFMPYWSLNLDEDAVESRNGGWLDGLVFNVNGDAGNAVSQIQSGALDIYPEILANVNLFETVKGDPSLAYDITLVSFDQLMFNTVGCATGTNKLNPFTNMKIREAMNWAVNREYIADTIFGGLAKPKFTLLTTDFPDYYRYKTTIDSIASNYAFDLSKAQTVVDTEMTSMGAFKNGSGKWVYNFGSIISPNIQPVTIIGLIRTEDKRLQIGDYFADQLELLGFTVDRQHKTRSQASPIWQGTDLDQCRFNFYTAGWINTSVSRDEGNMFAQYNSSMIQLIPLFEHYAPSTSYLNTMTKLMNNNFADMSERDSLFNQALDDSMAESWHGLMAVDETGFTPRVTNLKVASDLVGGTVTPFWPYTIRFEGKTGGEVHASLDSILNGVWNPIAGSNWYNDLIIQKGTGDAGVIPDPLTGLNHAKRIENAEVIVLDGLPMQKTEDWITLDRAASIPVPTDAWVDWDATTQHFITAGTKYPGGLTARAKVVVTYPDLSGIKWQDGSSFSVADVVMYMILGFDRAKPESAIYDESSVGLLDAVMSSFKGVRIISTDPLTIESYTDMISLDAESLISGYNGWGGGFNFTWWPDYSTGEAPWHMIAAGIKAETEGLLAFSAEKSSALGIEPTNYIAGPALDTLKNKIGESAATGHIPYLPTLGAYITSTEAKNRWTNYQDWFATHEHLWVGSGPYFIDQVYPIESKIILKWFNNYPDISDKWDSLIP